MIHMNKVTYWCNHILVLTSINSVNIFPIIALVINIATSSL